MKSTLQKLEEIKQYGYNLDFGQALEQAFNNYKKIALLTGAVVLVLIIIFYALFFGVMLAVMGAVTITDLTDFQAQESTTVMLIGNLFGSVIFAVLAAPLSAGLLQIAHNAETYKEFSFSTAFEHYKSKYIKDIFLATLILSLGTNIFALLMELLFPLDINDGTLYGANFWMKILVAILTLIIAFMTFLTIPLIIFGNLKATDAIKGSLLLVSKRIFIIFFLLLVALIGGLVGGFACCIGIVFTLPILYSMQYTIYRTAVDIEDNSELDEIGFDSSL